MPLYKIINNKKEFNTLLLGFFIFFLYHKLNTSQHPKILKKILQSLLMNKYISYIHRVKYYSSLTHMITGI